MMRDNTQPSDTLTTALATADDLDVLVALLQLLFTQEVEFEPDPARQRQGLSALLQDCELGDILVLRAGQKVIGMATLLYTISTALGERVAILEDLVVHPNHRNRSVGSRLLNAAQHHTESAGCGRITLLTDADNLGARRLYQRHGFRLSTMVPFRLSLPHTGTTGHAALR